MQCNEYWFRPKRYGYGFVPVSWEGWLLTIALVLVLLGLAWAHGLFAATVDPRAGFLFLFDFVIATILFSFFAARRMKEPLAWRWGSATQPVSFSAFLKKIQK